LNRQKNNKIFNDNRMIASYLWNI